MTLDNVGFSMNVAGTLNNSLDLSVIAKAALALSKSGSFTNGTGASQADRLWFDTATIAASGTLDLDMAGVLTDALGGPFTIARIKLLAVYAYPANTNNVVIGGGTNPITTIMGGTTPTINVRPGGMLLLTAPDLTAYGVTAATADILRIANSGAGTGVTFDIAIIGASV